MRVEIVADPILSDELVALINGVQIDETLSNAGAQLGVSAERTLVVRFADDNVLRTLNVQFCGEDKATDVLAFPADDPVHVGDIAISVEQAVRQSSNGHAADELRLLAVHGFLHCLGHDHDTLDGAATMTELTQQLLPDQTVPTLEAPASQ